MPLKGRNPHSEYTMKPARIVHVALFIIGLLIGTLAASAADSGATQTVGPMFCSYCGRVVTPARSRVRITYTNETSVDVCSLRCANKTLARDKDKTVQSLTVADYTTGELIDGSAATWVVGGSIDGGRNQPPKWAFASPEEAQRFVRDNGGQVTPYAEVMKAADEDADPPAAGAHGRAACHNAPGTELVLNPAFGDDIYHTHAAGCAMVSYKFMHTALDELRSGTSDVGLDQVGFMRDRRYNYMMIPTDMTMDMHMLMLMYGITDRFTVMGMTSYQDNNMDMLMDLGSMMPASHASPMRTDGFGDTELRGLFKIDGRFTGSLGVSLPTGDIDKSVKLMGADFRAPYDMQLGSGSYDLKPALTYSELSADALWNWGAQAAYTWHTAENDNDYRLGDSFKANAWLQRALGPMATWLRAAYSHTESIHGQDSEIQKLLSADPMMPMMTAPTPDADPANYGGQRVDGAIGLSCKIGPGSIGVEGGIPLYQDLNGLQLKTDWFLTAGAQVMF